MTCRETDVSSAVTSYGRIAHGLTENEMQGVFHPLVDEGASATWTDPDEFAAFVADLSGRVEHDPDLSPKRKKSILDRLRAATPDSTPPGVFYAVRRFPERARLARHALDGYYDAVARDLGVTRADVQALADEYATVARLGGRGTHAPDTFLQGFTGRAEAAHLPLDRISAYAFSQIEARRAANLALQPTRATVVMEPLDTDTIAAIGYNPSVGHAEVEFRSRPGHPYGYRMPPQVWTEFRTSPDPEAFYYARIRGNPDYMYATADDAEAMRTLRKCPTCGQYAALAGHACPPRGSVEERSRTVRLARAAVLGTPVDAPLGVRVATPTRWTYYEHATETGGTGDVATVGLSDARAAARRDTVASIPVRGRSVDPDQTTHTVQGRVLVEYLGRGRGYYLTAVTTPGDSGDDQLRCTCPDYAATYTCPHVRGLVADISNRLNADRVADPTTVAPGRRVDPAALTPDHSDAPEPARNTAPLRVAWHQPETLWRDDPTRWITANANAVADARRGTNPIPYFTEDVTAGMGDRATGRSFGVEIEFDLPPKMSADERDAALAGIGRALYRMGLTPTPRQEEYEEQRSRGYADEHDRGWAFKKDLSCHGEITSPIMWDEAATWTNLRRVCDTVHRYGGRATVNTGTHVHVSTADFGGAGDAHARLVELVNDHEDDLYRLATSPYRGTHRGIAYCTPNTTPSAGFTVAIDARVAQGERDVAVNFDGVTGAASDHVEYRLWDGTLDPAVIQTQIKVSLAMTQAAARPDQPERDPSTAASLGEHAANPSRGPGGIARDVADSTGFRALLDRVFWRDRDKTQTAALFALNPWQAVTGPSNDRDTPDRTAHVA